MIDKVFVLSVRCSRGTSHCNYVSIHKNRRSVERALDMFKSTLTPIGIKFQFSVKRKNILELS